MNKTSALGLGVFLGVFSLSGDASADSAAAPTTPGYLSTSCGTQAPPCFIQYGATVPVSGSISASLVNPTIGSAVPATGNYIAGNQSGLLAGVLLDGSGFLEVNCAAGCAGGSFNNANVVGVATSTTNGQAAAWNYGWNASTSKWDALQVDTSERLIVDVGAGTITVAQPTAANLNATVVGTGTFAVQATNATTASFNAQVVGVGTAGTAIGGVLTVQGTASMTKLLVTPDSVALPANQSVNLAQVVGTATSVNNGTVDAGTQRVAIASNNTAFTVNAAQATTASLNATVVGVGTAGTAIGGVMSVQGTASMTKLLVTPDSVALPANQSVNVAQMNGVTTTMNNGTADTGTQRVAIASNNTAIAGVGAAATGAAVPANAVYQGANTAGNLTGLIACGSSIVYDTNTNGSTQLVASGSFVTYVCGYTILSSGTSNVDLIQGTGAACATSPVKLTPAYQLTAQTGIADGSPYYRGLNAPTGKQLCLSTSATVSIQAIVYYTQF